MNAWISILALLVLALSTIACENPDTEELKRKLAEKDDPGDRAKIAVKIGENLLEEIGQAYKERDYPQGHERLGEYVELVQQAHRELEDSGRDARRKPKGFKELEIHLRRSHRTFEELARRVPFDQRQPVRRAMNQVEELRTTLLFALMGTG